MFYLVYQCLLYLPMLVTWAGCLSLSAKSRKFYTELLNGQVIFCKLQLKLKIKFRGSPTHVRPVFVTEA